MLYLRLHPWQARYYDLNKYIYTIFRLYACVYIHIYTHSVMLYIDLQPWQPRYYDQNKYMTMLFRFDQNKYMNMLFRLRVCVYTYTSTLCFVVCRPAAIAGTRVRSE